MRPQTKGAGSTDISRVNAPQTPHYHGAGLHWRDNSDYTAFGPTPRPVYRVNVMKLCARRSSSSSKVHNRLASSPLLGLLRHAGRAEVNSRAIISRQSLDGQRQL